MVMTDRYTHGHHESVLRSHRWRTAENSASFLLPHLSPEFSLLDVGCGPGTITADLARLLVDGAVIGVDRSPDVVAQAREAYPASERANLSFDIGDVYHLGFPDENFDVVYSHQVLQHLQSPVEALREMRRVLKPDGHVAVRDADYGGFIWAPTDPLLDRWMDVYHQMTRRNGAEADAGRMLKGWVRAAGFRELTVTSSTWTYESDGDRAWWGGLWADRVVQSEFASQSVEYGLTSMAELVAISNAFRRWSEQPDGVFILVHGEVLARR